jgi:RNA-directed DNA polymerase
LERVSEAEAFYRVLDKRLGRYGIELHRDESPRLPSRTKAAARTHTRRQRLPTYPFLGFTCYWGLAKNNRFWRLQLKSRSDRKGAKRKGLRQFLRDNVNAPNTPAVVAQGVAEVRGWVNYHAISDHQKAVNGFIEVSQRILFRWFNRRGGKRRMTWPKFQKLVVKVGYPTVPRLIMRYPTLKPA